MDAIAFDRAGPETGPYVIVVRPEGGWMWTGKMADIYEQTQEGGGIACPNSLFRSMMRTEKRSLPWLAEARCLAHKDKNAA